MFRPEVIYKISNIICGACVLQNNNFVNKIHAWHSVAADGRNQLERIATIYTKILLLCSIPNKFPKKIVVSETVFLLLNKFNALKDITERTAFDSEEIEKLAVLNDRPEIDVYVDYQQQVIGDYVLFYNDENLGFSYDDKSQLLLIGGLTSMKYADGYRGDPTMFNKNLVLLNYNN